MREISMGGCGDGEDIDELLAAMADDSVDDSADAFPVTAASDEHIVPSIHVAEIEAASLEVRATEIYVSAEEDDPVEESPPSATETAPLSGYSFPIKDRNVIAGMSRFNEMSSARLLEILDAMAYRPRKPSLTTVPYVEIRPWVIAASLILNQRRFCPPRFRSFRVPPPRTSPLAKEGWVGQLSNDRQVIDLHWLSCINPGRRLSGKWAVMFSDAGLDFCLASHFVSTVGNHETKLLELALHTEEVFHLAALQQKELADKWREIRARDKEVKSVLREWLNANKNTASDSEEDLSTQFRVLRLVGQSYAKAARLVELVSGKKTNSKTMQRRWELFHSLKLIRAVSK